MTNTSPSDKVLIRRLMDRDERALNTFFQLYQLPLLGFISKRIAETHIVEELVQDSFIQALESLRDFRYQCSLKTFIYTIARNKTIDYIRKKKIKQVMFSHLPSFITEQLGAVFLDDKIEEREMRRKFEKTLSVLPHDYQVILRLKYIEDHPVERIAHMMVRTFKSTESLLFRARKLFIKVYTTK
jgi:RNA polymerase sigma-70 factor, ECF subfamily